MFGAFQPLAFLVHVTQFEGRSLEKLIAPKDTGVRSSMLGGAVIEASYVQTDPPLLAHLAEARIPWMVDPQTVRFASPNFPEVARLRALPYARVREEQSLPLLDFEHLETWRAVLTRVATVVAVREG